MHKIDDKGYTPLHIACNEGHDDVALLLLEFGADIFTFAKDGNALYYAVISSLEKTVEKMLRMEPGCVNIDPGLRKGETALHIATKMDNQVIVKLLLDHKADVSIQDGGGNFAFGYSKDPAIHYLLADAAYELLRSMSEKGKEVASAS